MTASANDGGGIATLTVVTGPMYSGKTEETLRRIRRLQIGKRAFVLFRPSIDQRTREFISHAGRRARGVQAVVIDADSRRRPHLPAGTRAVFIDEGQFFTDAIAGWIRWWLTKGVDVTVSGLDTDSDGEVFETTATLCALADAVLKLTAVCVKCGGEARFSHRLVPGGDRVQVGGKTAYEALCRRCYREARASE